MKASDYLKRYEQQQKEKESELREGEEEHSLQEQAKERAKHPEHLNVGTPFDWEDMEAYQKELDRLDREGPGKKHEGSSKTDEKSRD